MGGDPWAVGPGQGRGPKGGWRWAGCCLQASWWMGWALEGRGVSSITHGKDPCPLAPQAWAHMGTGLLWSIGLHAGHCCVLGGEGQAWPQHPPIPLLFHLHPASAWRWAWVPGKLPWLRCHHPPRHLGVPNQGVEGPSGAQGAPVGGPGSAIPPFLFHTRPWTPRVPHPCR